MAVRKLSTPTKLPTRRVGDRDVSAIGFGIMNLSVGYGPAPPDEERFKLLDSVYEDGVNFWDTADCYGDNEVILGEWCVHHSLILKCLSNVPSV